jgi:hypothetical protein
MIISKLKTGAIIFFILILSYVYSNEPYIPDQYFGMHIHEISKFNEKWDIPLSAIRIWDAGVIWPDIEPKKGKWDFTKLDALVEFSTKRNLEILMTLGQTPGWASVKKNLYYPYGRDDILTSPPDDIKDWENYVQVVGERYKGKIKYWEVWNEPDHKYFYTGSIKDLVKLTEKANKILKSIDPENQIVCPSVTAMPGSLVWLDSYLYQGGKNYVDIIGYHYYTLSWVLPEAIRIHLASIKSIMKKYKITDKPIWTTEAGIYFDKISDKLLISYIARMYIIQRFYGSERFYWYALDNGNAPASGGLILNDRTDLNPGGKAYGVLKGWLVGKKIVSIKYSGVLCVSEIQSESGEKSIVVWSTGIKVSYKLPDKYNKIEALDGNSVIAEKGKIKVGLIPILIQ